jgi:hypothetical protein
VLLIFGQTMPDAAFGSCYRAFRYGWGWLAEYCEGATPSARRNMSLKLLGE